MARRRRSITPENPSPKYKSYRKIQTDGSPAALSCLYCIEHNLECYIMSSGRRCSQCALKGLGGCLAISGIFGFLILLVLPLINW
jgi:hypothetical protein